MSRIRIFVAVLTTALVASLPAAAGEVVPDAKAALGKALAGIGCTVEADDVDTTDDGYEAMTSSARMASSR